jgi:hypothetical protein
MISTRVFEWFRKWISHVAAVLVCCSLMTGTAWTANKRPEICYDSFIERNLMDKLANIAFAEAKRKKAWIRDYPGFIAVEMTSYRHKGRLIYGLRFTPFACGEMGLDGGGFDIEVDRKTFEVIDSYKSMR